MHGRQKRTRKTTPDLPYNRGQVLYMLGLATSLHLTHQKVEEIASSLLGLQHEALASLEKKEMKQRVQEIATINT
jgi:hypothetical protein